MYLDVQTATPSAVLTDQLSIPGKLSSCATRAATFSLWALAQPPLFEVTSIKPGNPELRLVRSIIAPGGNLRAENVTLRTLIEDAYRIKAFQLTGGPRWVDQDKFRVLAKGDASATADQVQLMFQTLL